MPDPARTSIRPFTADDTDPVVELSLRAWAPVFRSFEQVWGPALYARFYPDWKEEQATAVRNALGANETWVSVTDGAVSGFVNVIFNSAEKSGEIYMIAVDPSAQGQGVGGRLTDHATGEMQRRGLDLAIVATGGDPGHAPARRTYERAGFTGFPQVYYAKLLPVVD